MSLNSIVNDDLAEVLSKLSVKDVQAVISAAACGFSPENIHEGAKSIAAGETVPLPAGGNSPRPITVQAWSFVNDETQYKATYGVESARAAELKDLMRSDPTSASEQIQAIVTAALRKKGSEKAVRVILDGAPSSVPGRPASSSTAEGKAGRGMLKEEIRRDPNYYGLYAFEAEDTGRTGSQRFRVALGGGLYATHPSKVGAVDAARICRKHGRTFGLIADRIAFWIDGHPPLYGSDIPPKVTFSGVLDPSADPPATPVARAKTVKPEPPAGSSE